MTPQETQSLIWKALDGMASPDELAALRRQLTEDPAALDAFASAVARDTLLRELSTEKCSASTRMEAARQTTRHQSAELRPKKRGRTAPWLAAAAALLLSTGGFILLRGREPAPEGYATVASLQGEAQVLREESAHRAETGVWLRPGDVLETAAQARARLQYRDEATRLDLGAGARMKLFEERGAKRLLLDRGRLEARVAPQPAGRPLVIATPHARAEVVGTSFVLEAAADRTRLEVREGKVRLEKAGDAASGVLVQGGQRAVAESGKELAVAPLAQAAPVPAVPSPALLHLDFEDGLLPAGATGTVVKGPERPGNRFALAGAFIKEGREAGICKARLMSREAGLFEVGQKPLVLTLDYWADPQTASLDIFSWNATRQKSYGCTAVDIAHGRWTRLSIPLSQLKDAGLSLQPGDVMATLTVQPGQRDAQIYLDNIEITVAPAAPTPPPEW